MVSHSGGGVCIFYKYTLGVCIVKSLRFSEWNFCEFSIQNRKDYVGLVYRSPNQDSFEFENFLLNFEKVLSCTVSCNFSFIIILDGFNDRSSVWCSGDKFKYEGVKIESLAAMHVFHRVIAQPTHLLPQTSPCIDLIFTDQPNLIVDSGFHSSLHADFNHQITWFKLNLSRENPPPFERLVWDYNRANVEVC